MGIRTYEKPPPSTDVTGWLQVVAQNRLDTLRPEALVAAVQDLDPVAGKKAREAIALHLSDVIFAIAGPRVRRTYPNEGKDIVEKVHGQIVVAIFDPESADGKGLRHAFGLRIQLRLKDALRSEVRARRLGGVGTGIEETSASGADSDGQTLEPATEDCPTDLASLEVEDVLMLIEDDRKRLAFRLHMDGVPSKSTGGPSIEKAVGVSERTVRVWIEEIKKLLKTKLGEVYE